MQGRDQTAKIISLETRPAVRRFLRLVVDNAGAISAARKRAAPQREHYVDLVIAAYFSPTYDRALDDFSKKIWGSQEVHKNSKNLVADMIHEFSADRFHELYDYYLARINFFWMIEKILDTRTHSPDMDIRDSLETGLRVYAFSINLLDDIDRHAPWLNILETYNKTEAQRAINSVIYREIIFNENIPNIIYYRQMLGIDNDLNTIALTLGLDFETAKDALARAASPAHEDTRLHRLEARYRKRLKQIALPAGGFKTKEDADAGALLAQTLRDLQKVQNELRLPVTATPLLVKEIEAAASAYRRSHELETGEPIPPKPRGRPPRQTQRSPS